MTALHSGTAAVPPDILHPRRLTVIFVLIAVMTPQLISRGDEGAATAPTTRVTVRCTEASSVAGLPLRVLAYDLLIDALILTEHRVNFDQSGEAAVDLPRGRYCFEAGAGCVDGMIVAAHSNVVAVPPIKAVSIVADAPQALMLRHGDNQVELAQVAVRSVAAKGDIRWVRKSPRASPRLVLTPGKKVGLNVIGSTGSTHVAAWVPVTGNARGTNIELRTRGQWNVCSFIRRAGSPTMRSVTATVIFPDFRIEFPVTDTTRLVTNRRFVMIGYRWYLVDHPEAVP